MTFWKQFYYYFEREHFKAPTETVGCSKQKNFINIFQTLHLTKYKYILLTIYFYIQLEISINREIFV